LLSFVDQLQVNEQYEVDKLHACRSQNKPLASSPKMRRPRGEMLRGWSRGTRRRRDVWQTPSQAVDDVDTLQPALHTTQHL